MSGDPDYASNPGAMAAASDVSFDVLLGGSVIRDALSGSNQVRLMSSLLADVGVSYPAAFGVTTTVP
jgi:hypothetical protein